MLNKKHIVNLLLECPSIKDKDARHTLLAQLPTEMTQAIKQNAQPKVHVMNIVDA
jgi:hypothetical protein